MENPSQRWQNNLKMHEDRNEAREQDTALIPLFKIFGKTFEQDQERRALYAKELKKYGYTHKDISTAIDNIVISFKDLPSIQELLQFMPRKPQNANPSAYSTKAKLDEDKVIDDLRKQFTELLCNNNQDEYEVLMNKIVRAWFQKVFGYDQVLLDFYGISHKQYERCVLIDWRDGGFNPKNIFEVGIRKRNKI